MINLRDQPLEDLAAYLVNDLNGRLEKVKVVESVHFTNTYFHKLIGGFPLMVIWRSRRFHEENSFSGTAIKIHYLLSSAAMHDQLPGIMNSVGTWIYSAMMGYNQICPLIRFLPETYESEAKSIAYTGTKGVTELPLLEISFQIMDSHNP